MMKYVDDNNYLEKYVDYVDLDKEVIKNEIEEQVDVEDLEEEIDDEDDGNGNVSEECEGEGQKKQSNC
jgi:hypothetical protein